MLVYLLSGLSFSEAVCALDKLQLNIVDSEIVGNTVCLLNCCLLITSGLHLTHGVKFSTNREARYRKKLLPRVPHPGIISFIGEDQDVLIFQHLPLPDPLEAFPRVCARKIVPSMFCVITLEMWTTLKWKKI